MPKWLRKSLLVVVTVATFGLVTPQALLADPPNEDKQAKRDIYESTPSIEEESYFDSEEILDRDKFIDQMVKKAEEQSFMKFGTRIKPVIENEFKEAILPNIEKVIAEVALQYPEEDLSQLIVSEVPSGGTSEKIFHILNKQTKKDVIRFHVRRDHPPQESFAFNFHYHTVHDQFQSHYDLGIINWNKNTPPNWMS
ncbi:YpjP family protein [Bacillus sp. V3B]|uniref:YpjP family protein n=1 Tax=Bacillus sp. V3B TaxID=2804915 RepID=UPI00210E6F60|nr:YpjP family protein [Bacillus sp. V3B]MCQ6273977.1 YpjP family protein [Bacillus sp. V3B]